MPSPASFNFLESADNACIVGVTFRAVFTFYDDADGTQLSDLTDLVGRFRIVDSLGAELWSADSDTGGVVIDTVAGTAELIIAATDTAGFAEGTYHFDLDFVDGSASPEEVERVLHGDFQVVT